MLGGPPILMIVFDHGHEEVERLSLGVMNMSQMVNAPFQFPLSNRTSIPVSFMCASTICDTTRHSQTSPLGHERVIARNRAVPLDQGARLCKNVTSGSTKVA